MNTINDEKFEAAFNKMMRRLEKGITTTAIPRAYLLGGQPGAGKTVIADMFNDRYYGNIIFISGDEYRRLHPAYAELHKTYGAEAVLKTQEFAGKMTEALIDALSDKKYNLIIEGTLRTTEVPLKTKQLLERKGYEVELAVIMVKPEISYLSTLKRYHEMKEIGTEPRMTPKDHHDLVVKNLVENLDDLYVNHSFTNIAIYNRNKECVYSLKETPQTSPAHILRKEFNRMLTKVERNKLQKEFGKYLPSGKRLSHYLSQELGR